MLTWVRLAVVGGLCLAAQAQALDYKIGVVDPARVIE